MLHGEYCQCEQRLSALTETNQVIKRFLALTDEYEEAGDVQRAEALIDSARRWLALSKQEQGALEKGFQKPVCPPWPFALRHYNRTARRHFPFLFET